MCPYKASHYTGRFSHLEEKENKKKRNTNNTNNNSGVRDMKIILKLPAAAIEPVTPTHHHHHHHHHHHRHHRRPHHQLQQQQQHRQQSDDSRPASVRLRLLSLWLPEDRTESGSFFFKFLSLFFALFFWGITGASRVCARLIGSVFQSKFRPPFSRNFSSTPSIGRNANYVHRRFLAIDENVFVERLARFVRVEYFHHSVHNFEKLEEFSRASTSPAVNPAIASSVNIWRQRFRFREEIKIPVLVFSFYFVFNSVEKSVENVSRLTIYLPSRLSGRCLICIFATRLFRSSFFFFAFRHSRAADFQNGNGQP